MTTCTFRRSCRACSVQYAFNPGRDMQETYHKPWMVHELAGPVAGLESQNCTINTWPWASVQHELTVPVLWQLSGPDAEHTGAVATAEATSEPRLSREVRR